MEISFVVLQGIASLAILPSGNLSGHFIDKEAKKCYGLMGKELQCEHECSHGEDYRLLVFTLIDFESGEERQSIVERHGMDVSRIHTVHDAHGWNSDVISTAVGKNSVLDETMDITFNCDSMKADTEAELHLKKFSPSLIGKEAIVNLGPMTIRYSNSTQSKFNSNNPKIKSKKIKSKDIKSTKMKSKEVESKDIKSDEFVSAEIKTAEINGSDLISAVETLNSPALTHSFPTARSSENSSRNLNSSTESNYQVWTEPNLKPTQAFKRIDLSFTSKSSGLVNIESESDFDLFHNDTESSKGLDLPTMGSQTLESGMDQSEQVGLKPHR